MINTLMKIDLNLKNVKSRYSGKVREIYLLENDLNQILKKLYNTNFFETVSVKLSNDILIIKVKENPIIQNINYEGIKSSKILEDL